MTAGVRHNRLVILLSDGDFYRTWCADPQDNKERDEKKNILNVLLNRKNEDCERNGLYRRDPNRRFPPRCEPSKTSNARIIEI